MNWKTDEIVTDLVAILGKEIQLDKRPQGENYTRPIYVITEGDGISISGFRTDNVDLSDVDTPNEPIPFVEVRNFNSDCMGGISPDASDETFDAYHKVVRHFRQKGISVVTNLRNYF